MCPSAHVEVRVGPGFPSCLSTAGGCLPLSHFAVGALVTTDTHYHTWFDVGSGDLNSGLRACLWQVLFPLSPSLNLVFVCHLMKQLNSSVLSIKYFWF